MSYTDKHVYSHSLILEIHTKVHACAIYKYYKYRYTYQYTCIKYVNFEPIFLLAPVQISDSSSSGPRHVTYGMEVHLTCRAYGVPIPTITWTKNGEPVSYQYIITRSCIHWNPS